jgi:hypothetical protein
MVLLNVIHGSSAPQPVAASSFLLMVGLATYSNDSSASQMRGLYFCNQIDMVRAYE